MARAREQSSRGLASAQKSSGQILPHGEMGAEFVHIFRTAGSVAAALIEAGSPLLGAQLYSERTLAAGFCLCLLQEQLSQPPAPILRQDAEPPNMPAAICSREDPGRAYGLTSITHKQVQSQTVCFIKLVFLREALLLHENFFSHQPASVDAGFSFGPGEFHMAFTPSVSGGAVRELSSGTRAQ